MEHYVTIAIVVEIERVQILFSSEQDFAFLHFLGADCKILALGIWEIHKIAGKCLNGLSLHVNTKHNAFGKVYEQILRACMTELLVFSLLSIVITGTKS